MTTNSDYKAENDNTPKLAEAAIIPDVYDLSYRKARCCSVVFFMFGNKLINRVNQNDG